MADVFGDYPLAKTIERLEQDHREGGRDVPVRMGEAVRARYQFIETVPQRRAGRW